LRVIFLDFDGVLNGLTRNTGRCDATVGEYGSPIWCAEQIDSGLVEQLNKIVEATGAVVVISSSWRNAHHLNKLREMLKVAGFRGSIIGDTPRLHRTPDGVPKHRHDEIQMWLDAVGDAVESFVILDDWDMGYLGHRLVRSSVYKGLEAQHVTRAIHLLRRPV